jgi:RimJ/RimL family protein N-acetyltransferase
MPRSVTDLTWPARTERLSFRPGTEDDLDATWRYRRLPEVNLFLTTAPADRDEYAEHYLDPERLAKTLVIERDGEVIGDLMLALEDPWAQTEVRDEVAGTQAELGWALAPEHAGRGYALEAVRELMRICFEDLGLRRVVANCFLDNTASWRLMERLGMRREVHTVRESLHRSGEWMDGLGYALLADEWFARQAR